MILHRLTLTLLALFVLVFQLSAEPITRAGLETFPEDTTIVTLILMKERPDVERLRQMTDDLPRDQRSAVVWRELDNLAIRSQKHIRRWLKHYERTGDLQQMHSLRIANGLVLETRPSVLSGLVGHPEIFQIIEIRPRAVGDEGEAGQAFTSTRLDSVTWHIEHIQAPQVWDEGYTGEGVLVAIIDTGVNYYHFDLQDHMWDGGDEFPHHGQDFVDDDLDPLDISGHGTGVAGILAGDGTAGIATGVAPDATLMCLRVRQDLYTGVVTDAWLAQDFALEHGADIVSMSLGWGAPGPEDRPIWRSNYEVLEAAGIICTKSAGNRRQSRVPPSAISVPGDVPSPWRNPDEIEQGSRGGLITVGATNQENLFSEWSSPGPVTWENIPPWDDYPYGEGEYGLIKPDIAAPGVGGTTLTHLDSISYTPFSNTSMAQPHVAGTIALMLSKNFNLLPVEVDSILQTTALDLGPAGKDNDYGAGLVRALDAVNAVPNVSVDDLPFGHEAAVPETLALDVIYPNPFNPWTTIRVVTTKPGRLTIMVYNAVGQRVRELVNSPYAAGMHEVEFDATGLASGSYIVKAELNGREASVTRKITYTK